MSEFIEYNSYPEYNGSNDIKQSMESINISEIANYKNPTLLSDEINYNEEDVIVKPTKYVKPKYKEVQKTYKVLKPIIHEPVTLPVKIREKVRTIDPVYNKTIVLSGEEEYNNIIEYGNQNYPLPTQSTIQNLCKESVIGSENYYSSYYVPKYPETYENKLENDIIPKETYQTIYEDNNLNENQEQNNYKEQFYQQNNEQESSKNYPSHYQENKFQSANVDYHLSKPQMSNAINNENKNTKSDNLKIEYQNFNISKRPKKEYQISKMENQQIISNNNNNYQSSNKQIISNNNNYQSSNIESNKKPKIITESHISHVQIKKLPNISQQDKNKYQSKIYQPNLYENTNHNIDIQNNVEEDDDIPKPIVYEGESLEKSEIKEENMDGKNNLENNNIDDIDNIFKQSAEKEPEKHYSKIKKIGTNSFFENLPVDQTEIISIQPSIDKPKVQKIDMAQNSLQYSSKPPQQSQQFPQSKLDQSKVNPKSLFPSKIQITKLTNSGQKSIRVQKIESNSHYYSKNNYNFDIPRDQSIPESNNEKQPNINKVKESNKYQQPFQDSNINEIDEIQEYNNYEEENLNNQSNNAVGQMNQKSYIPENKSSFPTESYCGKSIISKSKLPQNPFQGEDNIENSSVPLYENKVKIIKK